MNLQVVKIEKIKIHIIRLKTLWAYSVLILIGLFLHANIAKAQSGSSATDKLGVNLELKNMHLWHGFVVTPGVMMASSIEYGSTNEKFIAGLWGGASFNGQYKEFSYYTKYNFANNFNVSLISHNNYSEYEDYDIFSYNKYTSPNFVDIVFEYTLSNEIPLRLYWSTILFGNGGDFEIEDDGTDTNSYSNYVEMSYTLFPEKKTNLTLFAGGAFSFITEKTFYSQGASFVNLGLSVNHNLEFFSKKFPVTGTAFWNPESRIGALQLAIAIF